MVAPEQRSAPTPRDPQRMLSYGALHRSFLQLRYSSSMRCTPWFFRLRAVRPTSFPYHAARLPLPTAGCAVRCMASSTNGAASQQQQQQQQQGERLRIGWIGTGVMGSSMCAHVMGSASPAYATTVYNRTAAKAQALVQRGATLAASPEEVAAASDVLFSIVGHPADVRAVYFGDGTAAHPGVLARLRAGALVIDMTTSEPSLAVEIAAAAKERGIAALDAPVSGGDVGARNAALSIMVGGSEEAFARALPLLQAMGKNITHCGEAGSGQHTKMVNQTLIASNMVGVCEGLLYAYKAGLDLSTTIKGRSIGRTDAEPRLLRPLSASLCLLMWSLSYAVQAGAAGSWSISNLGPRIIARDFQPGFFVAHFVKDLSIILAESRRMNLSLPGLSLAYSLYMALMAQGGAELGTQALYTALERLNAIEEHRPAP